MPFLSPSPPSSASATLATELAACQQELVAIQQELEATQRRLEETQRVAQIGSWEFTPATGAITWSAETFRLFGFDPTAGPPDFPQHLSRHHPEDQPLLLEAVQQALTDGTPYDLQLRVCLAPTQLRWMHCQGRAILGDDGKVVKLTGTSQDITAWKQTELEQQRRERTMAEVLDVMPHLAILIDPQGRTSYRNGHFYSFTGLCPSAIITNWRELFHPDDLPVIQSDLAALPLCTETYERELRIRRHDGVFCWHLMRVVPLFAGEDAVQRFVVTGTDISTRRAQEDDLNRSRARLEVQATTDALTGVFNRYVLEERLGCAWEKARAQGEALSLVLLDVDHFKSYNDTFGHVCGDAVLRQLGELLLSNVRTTDFVARYGGEEFLIVLPNTDSAAAHRWAERIRTQIESRVWPRRAITASLGVASWPGRAASHRLHRDASPLLEELIALTDAALYLAKQQRNRVSVTSYTR